MVRGAQGAQGLMAGDVDLVVVGAGAAGLGAARRAIELGLTVRVLEARGRIGGRAWTDTATLGHPVDKGCHWIHVAEENPWVAIAEGLGFPVSRPAFEPRSWIGQGWLGEAEEKEADDAVAAHLAALEAAGRDVAASEVLPREGRWARLADAILAWDANVDLPAMSTLDMVRFRRGADWPQAAGLGMLVAAYGRGVPVTLDCPVGRIDWGGPGVRLETPQGALAARAAIVTVPVGVLAAGTLRFAPALPPAIRQAIDDLPMGLTEKVVLELPRDALPVEPDTFAAARTDTARMAYLKLYPFGRPQVLALFTGGFAVELAQAGEAAMAAQAVDELAQAFGSGVRRRVGRSLVTRWHDDPWALGAYSAARPGRATARDRLWEPFDDRLFLAGEACSIPGFGTLHGALATGIAAAERAAAALA